MKVLVLCNRIPFVWGGAEELATHLVRNLRLHGHEAECMRIPFAWDPPDGLINEMLVARSLRITNVDRVISLKFPAYLIPHDNHVIWLLHQHRQVYDLFDAGQSNIPATPAGDALRQAIREADNQAFAQARALFALPNSTRRLKKYNGLVAEDLWAPLNDPHLFTGGEDGGYIFAGGRVGHAKRQFLLIEALAYAPKTRLVVAGPPESADTHAQMLAMAERLGVADRVTFDLRFMAREEVAGLVNGCTASAYIPFDEDYVGYVTLEAFQAGKPVLTTSDSGGVLDAVSDGVTGLVAAPDPIALGKAMRQLTDDRRAARTLGANALAFLHTRDLTWPKTLERLLA